MGWDGEGQILPTLSFCLSVLKQLDPRRCLVFGPGGGEGIRRLQKLPQPLPRWPAFSGCALSRECLPVESQSLPCTLMPVPLSSGQVGARGMGPPPDWGKEASCFLPFPVGQPCFPPQPTLGNREGGRGEGGP